MIKVGRNKVVHAVLLMCVVMQLAAMLPHHHHEGSEAVCIDYFCSGCGDDVCGDYAERANRGDSRNCGAGSEFSGNELSGHEFCGHGHSGHAPATCNSHKLVLTQPKRDDIEIAVSVTDVHEGCHGDFCVHGEELFMAGYDTGILRLELERCPDIEPIIMEYISVAHPSRAADLLA